MNDEMMRKPLSKVSRSRWLVSMLLLDATVHCSRQNKQNRSDHVFFIDVVSTGKSFGGRILILGRTWDGDGTYACPPVTCDCDPSAFGERCKVVYTHLRRRYARYRTVPVPSVACVPPHLIRHWSSQGTVAVLRTVPGTPLKCRAVQYWAGVQYNDTPYTLQLFTSVLCRGSKYRVPYLVQYLYDVVLLAHLEPM